ERTTIEIEAQKMMQTTFDRYGLGVKVVTIKLQNIVPPVGDVQDAFEDVNKAIQDMNRYINEGKEDYNSKIPAAQGEAEKMVLVAEGYSAERVNNAKGDVSRFTSVQKAYETSKDITSTRLYIETLEEILTSDTSKLTLIDKNLENFLPISNITAPTSNAVTTTDGGTK
ncbi:MAG: FtsH protease activity modulator HflK, partial [Sphaerochaetaceae bacterium]